MNLNILQTNKSKGFSSEKSIKIGTTTLKYITNGDRCIITYLNNYNTDLTVYLQNIYKLVIPFYKDKKMKHDITCGDNSDYICNNVKIDGHRFGKIIMNKWVVVDDWNNRRADSKIISIIESVYGNSSCSIGASYHALSYIEIEINNNPYFIAIESTIRKPYILQYYVGESEDELKTILKARYQCIRYRITEDCSKAKMWFEIENQLQFFEEGYPKVTDDWNPKETSGWNTKYPKSISNNNISSGGSKRQYNNKTLKRKKNKKHNKSKSHKTKFSLKI